jgi:hypothetical protein
MSEMITSIVLFAILVVLHYCIKQNKSSSKNTTESFVDTDKIYLKDPYIMNEFADPPSTRKPKEMKFNYTIRPVDKQFLNEQEHGVNLNTWYPSTYIEKLDKNGKPIWGSREKSTCSKDTMVQEKTRMTYDFNQPKSIHMDGPINPDASCTLKERSSFNLAEKQSFSGTMVFPSFFSIVCSLMPSILIALDGGN